MLALFLDNHSGSQSLTGYLSANGKPAITEALADLCSGELTPGLTPNLQAAYSKLVGSPNLGSARDVTATMKLDPVAAVLGSGKSAGSGEQQLVARLCAYLDERQDNGQPDLYAARLFWQVVRIRTILYRHIVQRPLTPGLEWFIRFYGRLSATCGDVEEDLCVDAAIARCGASPTLESLEVRTRPGSGKDLHDWVEAVVARGRRDPGQTGYSPEVGLVFHFVKSRFVKRPGKSEPERPPGGRGSHADPFTTVNASGYRYAQYYQEQRKEALALASLLHDFPRSLYVVRGLDLCSDELAVPAWVFKPLFGCVRRAAENAARWLARWPAEGEALTAPPPRPPPLRTTVHVGEDFAHLLTGLRNVHDAIRVLELREGDRIGHGMALGVDPFDWAGRTGRVAIPLEDRAFDLAWEWTWWTKRGSGVDDARMAYLAREIPLLGEKWFGDSRLRPLDLEHLAEDLTDPLRLSQEGFPNGPAPRSREGPQWLNRYLTDVGVFRRGRQVCWVDPENEATAIDRIGASLREEIGHLGLAVEINPTSNLLIGDLSDLNAHPLWRISPPVRDPATTRLAITIGSDDPIIFNSDLPQEYQRLYDALVLAGLSDADALAWLDGVRQTGLERKFTTSVPTHRADLWADPNPRPREFDGLL